MKIGIRDEKNINGKTNRTITILFDKSHDEFFAVIDWLRENYIADKDYVLGFEDSVQMNIFSFKDGLVDAFKQKWL